MANKKFKPKPRIQDEMSDDVDTPTERYITKGFESEIVYSDLLKHLIKLIINIKS
jgi:hypothetical protein